MDLGIHRISQTPTRSCYFIKRDFGNILAFADALTHADYDFLKSKGGVYKQFIESTKLISLAQCELFKRFGSQCVINDNSIEKADDHNKVPVETFGQDYFDHSLHFSKTKWGGQALSFKQGKQKIMVLGHDFHLNQRGSLFINEALIGESFYETAEANNISWMFCCSHEDHSYIRL